MNAVDSIAPRVIPVTGQSELKQASQAVRSVAQAIGFSPDQCAELELVATELGSNLIEHASGGTIRISRVQASGREGIRLEAEDEGPGITDLERAFTDGFSTKGTLGTGMGAINRLMDELELDSTSHGGLRIVCDRWLRSRSPAFFTKNVVFGVATRACRLQTVNGDAFVIKEWEGHALVSVIDGLGHGTFAQRAAHAARHYIESHYDQPLEVLFRGVERACRATRGVVMAIARFDTAARKLTIANVGNIEVRLMGRERHSIPRVRRGIVGLNAPRPVTVECPWDDTTLLVMHSDGLRSHWSMENFPGLLQDEPPVIASCLLDELGKTDDDATVIVARPVLS